MTYRGRFAPSPTGALHFGSLVAAVGSWIRARSQNGIWLVRMEDLDPPREVPGAAAEILETLAAFGMEPDEPVKFQSRRESAYASAFARLDAAGRVFPCWCSRADLEASSGIHRTCVAAPEARRVPAWRLRAPDGAIEFVDAGFGPQAQNLRDVTGDFVIRRVEGGYAYQLAVVVDDAEQGITEVVRGADLLDSTPRQIHLQRLLGLPTPAYLHLPLVLDADGRKLSKQDRARAVDRTDPVPALRAALAFLGQRVPEAGTAERMLDAAAQAFDLAALRGEARKHACTIGQGPE
ncbi:MAG: tRNA glutamyl-Q(34) synthetase GluQRS [Proteobacteria bacterium]|nr:tRNA glutamyl-Q(34) synthetase GluQRS [Pseudomonadota bacterium]